MRRDCNRPGLAGLDDRGGAKGNGHAGIPAGGPSSPAEPVVPDDDKASTGDRDSAATETGATAVRAAVAWTDLLAAGTSAASCPARRVVSGYLGELAEGAAAGSARSFATAFAPRAIGASPRSPAGRAWLGILAAAEQAIEDGHGTLPMSLAIRMSGNDSARAPIRAPSFDLGVP